MITPPQRKIRRLTGNGITHSPFENRLGQSVHLREIGVKQLVWMP
jgi:hypothetical protein